MNILKFCPICQSGGLKSCVFLLDAEVRFKGWYNEEGHLCGATTGVYGSAYTNLYRCSLGHEWAEDDEGNAISMEGEDK